MTQIQNLSYRVVLLKRRIIEEDDGSFKEHWEESDSVWAQIIPYTNHEIKGEGWNSSQAFISKYKVIMRYREGRFSRLQWDDRTLALLCPPSLDQFRKWLTCFTYALGENDE
jgi:head-tail adaptor